MLESLAHLGAHDAIITLGHSSPPKRLNIEPHFITDLTFASCLGQGAFGIVLQAVHSTTKLATAVKFIFPTGLTTQEKQIFRECELTRTLDHENIVKILNVTRDQLTEGQLEKVFENLSEEDGESLNFGLMYIAKAKRFKTVESICIQMELCGPNLRKWLNLQHDKTDEVVQLKQMAICRDIVDGLAYLHKEDIMHRDLKPENVMLSDSDFGAPVKIGDFGLCRRLPSTDEVVTSKLTSRVGTEDYMAPETFTNDYSFQADLFSLGLVIWEVIQLIPFRDRKPLFDRLVNDKDETAVQQFLNTEFKNLPKLIIHLTKKNKSERMQRIQDIGLTFSPLSSSFLVTVLEKSMEMTVLDNPS